MSMDRRSRTTGRRASLINVSYYRGGARQPPVIWNLQGVRGQMSSNCLWHACRALFAGLLLLGVGTVMCISGFYADGIFDENNNSTSHYSREMYFRDPARQGKFSKLSFIGPFVMGVGGFIIVATCVMTFEARDSAAKVGPAAFGTTTSSTSSHVYPLASKSRREVQSVACQTQTSSLTGSTLQLFDRKHLMEAFRKFSKTLRSSSSVSSWQGEQLHRSPSAPSLLNANIANRRGSSINISNTRKFLQKNKTRVPPALRQAVSVDYSNSSNFQPLSVGQNSSTQTLMLPPLPTPYLTRLNSTASNPPRPKIQRSIYSSSSECNPSSKSLDDDCGSNTTVRFENEGVIKSVNASIHFECDMTDSSLPNGLSLNVLKPNGAGPSSSSLRTISPHPSYYSDDSTDLSPVKGEQALRSPIHQKSRLRSAEFSYNRPSLLRQPRVDYTEIICSPYAEDKLVIEEEDLSTIPE